MKRWKAILGVLLVFLIGMKIGAMIPIFIGRHIAHRIANVGPAVLDEIIVRDLARELRLDVSQREKLAPIVSDAHAKIREVRRTIDPQIAAIVEHARGDVRTLLTPEQTKKFDELVARRKSVWLQAN